MFEYLEGTASIIPPAEVALQVGGVGYCLHVPVRYLSTIQEGESYRFYIASFFREPDLSLYGFLNREERNCFRLLLTVSGVGPKLALAILGHLSLDDFQSLVTCEDVKMLKRVPGVGARMAERLLVEFKGRFAKGQFGQVKGQSLGKEAPSQFCSEAEEALMKLGYTEKEAHKSVCAVVERSPEKASNTSLIITEALKQKLS